MGFALQSNPFFGLSASPRDGRERLADLAEEAVEQGRLTRPEAQALLRALTASRPRLEAELGWLPGIAPATARRAAERAVAAGDRALAANHQDALRQAIFAIWESQPRLVTDPGASAPASLMRA